EQTIKQSDSVSGCLSAATFSPEVNLSGGSLRSFVTNRRLMQARPRLIDAGYLVPTEEEELYRISVRVIANSDLDYGEFQHELQAQVESVLATIKADGISGVSATCTGAIAIIYKARRSLHNG